MIKNVTDALQFAAILQLHPNLAIEGDRQAVIILGEEVMKLRAKLAKIVAVVEFETKVSN